MPALNQPCVPMLEVADLQETMRFYVDVLGFTCQGTWGHDADNPSWCSLRLGAATLMFTWSPPHDHGDGDVHSHEPALSGSIYCYPDDVDALAAELEGKVTFEFGPQTMIYGMREFGVRDPNGYMLIFGAEVES